MIWESDIFAIFAYVAYVAIYVGIVVLILRPIWRRTKAQKTVYRVFVRTFFIAFFLSPTFFACGAAAFTPFPLLVLSEIIVPLNPCSRQVNWNLPIVGVTWCVALFAYVLVLAWGRYQQRDSTSA